MSTLINIDFNKKLPFNIESWTVTTWPGDANIKGIKSNTIGHNGTTSFFIRAKWEYLKFSFLSSSEGNYDYLQVIKDGLIIYNGNGVAQNTPIVVEKTFDGSLSTIEFRYRKDGSGSSGYDSVIIKELQCKSVDDELLQDMARYGIKATDGVIYTKIDGIITKVADSIELMTKELYLSFSEDQSIMNDYNTKFGNAPKLLKYTELLTKPYLGVKYKCFKKSDPLITIQSFNLKFSYVTGIKNFEVDVTKGTNDVIRIAFSVDEGLTWIVYKNNTWIVLQSLEWAYFIENGMNDEEVRTLPIGAFEMLYSTKKLKVAILLKPDSISSILKLNKFNCNYALTKEAL